MASPYDKNVIVSVFVRLAKQQPNPSTFLLDLLRGGFSVVSQGDATVLTSTSTGGSSATWELPPGMTRMDVLEITELALLVIETGVDMPPVYDPATGAHVPAEIRQVPVSQRLMSYGQFGGIHR